MPGCRDNIARTVAKNAAHSYSETPVGPDVFDARRGRFRGRRTLGARASTDATREPLRQMVARFAAPADVVPVGGRIALRFRRPGRVRTEEGVDGNRAEHSFE